MREEARVNQSTVGPIVINQGAVGLSLSARSVINLFIFPLLPRTGSDQSPVLGPYGRVIITKRGYELRPKTLWENPLI